MKKTKHTPSIFTPQEFRYWIFKVGLNERAAALFLGVDVKTIQGYMYGRFRIDERLTFQCRQYEKQKSRFTPQIGKDQVMSLIQIGDVFQLGDHRLMCGDAQNPEHFKKLMGKDQATMVFTDPPYNVNYGKSRKRLSSKGLEAYASCIENDCLSIKCYHDLLSSSIENMMKYCKGAFYIFMADKSLSKLITLFEERGGIFSKLLIAVKGKFIMSWANYHPRHELILYGWKKEGKRHWCGSRKEHTLFDFKVASNKLHPTMKPVDLIERAIINSSRENDIVLDCFAGSGSTLIAAHNQNRVCYSMEISPAYCQVILDRFEEHTGIMAERLNDSPYRWNPQEKAGMRVYG